MEKIKQLITKLKIFLISLFSTDCEKQNDSLETAESETDIVEKPEEVVQAAEYYSEIGYLQDKYESYPDKRKSAAVSTRKEIEELQRKIDQIEKTNATE